MDFAEYLRENDDTLEIAFDGLGRAELFNGRLRLTFYREIVHADGSVSRVPCICLVCTPQIFQRARVVGQAVVQMINEAAEAPRLLEVNSLGIAVH